MLVVAKGTFEPEVKPEAGLEGENIGGKECLSRKRFERYGVADAESICGDYNIRAFLLEASRSICEASGQRARCNPARIEVDVECPSPACRAICECSSDYRPQDRSEAPCETSASNIYGTFVHSGCSSQQGHDTNVHSRSSYTANSTSNNQAIY